MHRMGGDVMVATGPPGQPGFKGQKGEQGEQGIVVNEAGLMSRIEQLPNPTTPSSVRVLRAARAYPASRDLWSWLCQSARASH